MLARSNRPFPLEIYSLIYSHLELKEITPLLRTCHALFGATVAHVWREVILDAVLKLLPGCISGHGEAEIATGFSDSYFARFDLYAPYVERLTSRPGSIAHTPSPEFLVNWLPSFFSGRATLPALKFADIFFERFSLVNDDPWRDLCIRALVPRTLGYLSFTAARLDDLQLLAFIFVKCPGLTRLKFRFDRLPNWDIWAPISKCGAPQSIEDLEVESYTFNGDAFSWLSSMPRLKKLKLHSHSSHSELDPSEDLSLANYHGSFEILKHLDIFIYEIPVLERIWHTPLVTHLTHVRISTFGQVLNSEMFRGFCATLAKCSPGVSSFTFCEHNATHPSDLRPPAISLNDIAVLRPLELQVLRIQTCCPVTSDEECCILDSIGAIWPNLEELCLGKTWIKLEDLFQVSTYLPKIRSLGIRIPTTAALELWSSALQDYAQPPDGFRPGSALIIGFSEIKSEEKHVRLTYGELETLARTLLAHWSKVSINHEDLDSVVFEMIFDTILGTIKGS